MTNFTMPFFLKIEEGLFDNLSEILATNLTTKKKAIIGIDSVVKNIYGDKVIEQIEKIFPALKLIIIDTNDLDICFDIAKLILSEDYDVMIGIGGGRVLDVCKYAAHMSKVAFVSIPTAIAHDGVASPIAVLKCGNQVKSFGASIPYGIIVDLKVIASSPSRLMKAGIGDTLSNYTAIKDCKLAIANNKESIDDFAIILSELSAKSVLNHYDKNLNNLDFVKTVVESCITSGMAMNLVGNSKPCSGSEHLISHAMDMLGKQNLHGLQVGVSAIVANYLHGQDPYTIINFLKIFNLPTTLEELGFNFEDFIFIMKNAMNTRPGRYTVLNETDLSDKNILKIYEACFESQKQ